MLINNRKHVLIEIHDKSTNHLTLSLLFTQRRVTKDMPGNSFKVLIKMEVAK